MARRKREPETASIDSLTHDGRGIAAVEGKKVFVAGALQGERVRFQRRKRRRNFDEAELLEVLEPSPRRIAPRCEVFGVCGGCSLQHMSAADQREIKLQTLKDNLARIGKVEPKRWLEPLFDTSEEGGWHYRRRARLAVKDVPAKGRVLVGFRERHAPFVTNMHTCEVLAAPAYSLLDPLSELIAKLSIHSRLPQIEVAVADNATALVFRVLDPPTDDDRSLMSHFADATGVRVLLQPGGLDSIEPLVPADPVEPLYYEHPEYQVRIEFEATDFVQVNTEVNKLMVRRAIEMLDISDSHRVLDLFCGIGNFSLPMATRAAHVLGLEGEDRQVIRATANAAVNNTQNAEFRTADLASLSGRENWMRQQWDRILLDPARSGAAEVLEHIDTLGAERIVYVSCHPGTLARDTEQLVGQHGYELEAAGIIDMFPHTAHVESIAVFVKRRKNK